MRRKPPEIDFDQETAAELAAIRAKIGKEVPLTQRYTRGPKATLVSIEGEFATLLFPNGAQLSRVPLKDLVDDSSFWKS
jgi:hypothetical protein